MLPAVRCFSINLGGGGDNCYRVETQFVKKTNKKKLCPVPLEGGRNMMISQGRSKHLAMGVVTDSSVSALCDITDG